MSIIMTQFSNILNSEITLTISARCSIPLAVVVKCWSKAKVEVEVLYGGNERPLRVVPTAGLSMMQ